MPTVSTDTCDDVVLAADPFVANRYHFGMLLGVDDLDTDQSYHRGKAWLHAAWLHGAGTVWGLEVLLRVEGEDDDQRVSEVQVLPGLAVDHRGRELSLTTTQCVDPVLWAQEQGDGLTFEEGEDTRSFTAHVVVCFDPCRTRPVPSIADPCTVGTDDTDTAYSRVRERARVELRPGPAPAVTDQYPRLSELMGITPPDEGGDGEGGGDGGDGGELDADAAAEARAAAQLAALDARVDAMTELTDAARCAMRVRGRAAIDAMSRRPADGAAPYPVGEADSCVLLAELTIVVTDDDSPRAVPPDDEGDGSTVDNTVRPAHVDTTSVLGLLACPPAS